MKKMLKSIYEKNNATLLVMYIGLKVLLKLAGKYKNINDEIVEGLKNFEQDKSTKLLKKQYRKLLVYRYIYDLRASEYYLYNFENNSYKKRETFMTRHQTAKYYKVINDEKFRKILDKKNLSYEVLKQYYKRDLICITGEEDKIKLKNFVNNNTKFIIKPFDGHSGNGIEIIKKDNFKDYEELFEYLLTKVPFIAEELIKQSHEIGCFHEKSVNTVRVVTFQYEGDFSILWTFLRTGQGNNEVDNMGAMGVGALIDSSNGKIISDGIDWRGAKVEKHPDSKIQFKGFEIPKWDELIETVKKLASEMSEMHCVGWDLALTNDGWVLVEGNARPQCVTIQTFTKKGYKKYYDNMYNLVKRLNDRI